jgi:hypothetical protein
VSDEEAVSVNDEMQTQALELKHKVDGLVVKDRPSFEAGEALRGTLKEAIKTTTDFFREPKAEAHRRHKKLLDAERRALAPLKDAEATLKRNLLAYANEQRRIAEEKARKEREKAREQAEKEQRAKAQEFMKLGDFGAAKSVLSAPVAAPAPPKVNAPKVKGARKTWSAEVTDMKAFVQACWRGECNMSLAMLLPDQVALNKLAVALKQNFSVPGVRAVCREG